MTFRVDEIRICNCSCFPRDLVLVLPARRVGETDEQLVKRSVVVKCVGKKEVEALKKA